MEVEYSNQRRTGQRYAYALTAWERKTIAEALIPVCMKLDKKIERIKNHPKNEGQATFAAQIDEARSEIRALNEIIKIFMDA